MSTLIVGCGYLGRRVGERLVGGGERVFGTTRSPAKAEAIARLGIEPIIADVVEQGGAGALTSLPHVDRVFYCVGLDRSTGIGMRTVYVDGLSNLLESLSPPIRRLIYASSTSVYGQTGGEWVDEETPAVPIHESGRICLEAEQVVSAWGKSVGTSTVVLRFSGLYGPGRIVRRAILERGEPIPADPDHFLNMVHIDDAARASILALEARDPGPLYLVSDSRPVERREYYALVARLLGAPAPRFEPPSPGTREAARDAASRRVSSQRVRAELGLELRFPDITVGVPAALEVG